MRPTYFVHSCLIYVKKSGLTSYKLLSNEIHNTGWKYYKTLGVNFPGKHEYTATKLV